jgi:hypothetical protein
VAARAPRLAPLVLIEKVIRPAVESRRSVKFVAIPRDDALPGEAVQDQNIYPESLGRPNRFARALDCPVNALNRGFKPWHWPRGPLEVGSGAIPGTASACLLASTHEPWSYRGRTRTDN